MGKKLVRQKALKFKACLMGKYIGYSVFKMIFMDSLDSDCISFKDELFNFFFFFLAVLGKAVLSPRQVLYCCISPSC